MEISADGFNSFQSKFYSTKFSKTSGKKIKTEINYLEIGSDPPVLTNTVIPQSDLGEIP